MTETNDDRIGRWWATLNCYEWPEDMPIPPWADKMTRQEAVGIAWSIINMVATESALNKAWSKRIGGQARIRLTRPTETQRP